MFKVAFDTRIAAIDHEARFALASDLAEWRTLRCKGDANSMVYGKGSILAVSASFQHRMDAILFKVSWEGKQ